jgi:hypothetical protein
VITLICADFSAVTSQKLGEQAADRERGTPTD